MRFAMHFQQKRKIITEKLMALNLAWIFEQFNRMTSLDSVFRFSEDGTCLYFSLIIDYIAKVIDESM